MGVGVLCSVIFYNFAFCQGQSALPQHPHRLASHAPSQELLNALTKTSSTTIMEAHLPAAVVDATMTLHAFRTQALMGLESGSTNTPLPALFMAVAMKVSFRKKTPTKSKNTFPQVLSVHQTSLMIILIELRKRRP